MCLLEKKEAMKEITRYDHVIRRTEPSAEMSCTDYMFIHFL